jgi:hypothetical protein
VAGQRWKAAVAGMPCTIEAAEHGEWIVTIAASSLGRGQSLADAIHQAGGGLVSLHEARSLAAAVENRRATQSAAERESAVPTSRA